MSPSIDIGIEHAIYSTGGEIKEENMVFYGIDMHYDSMMVAKLKKG